MEVALSEIVRPAVAAVVEAGRTPGLVVALARGDGPPQQIVVGGDGAGRPLAADSLFPIASVTKLATALALLRLADSGDLGVDDPLAEHLPDAAAAQPGVTLRALLSHTAGLPIDVARADAPYAPGLGWAALARACLATPLERAPRTRVQYGNVGYGLLALVVERRTGQGFAAALDALVLAPLGVEAYLGVEPPRPPAALSGVRSSHTGGPLEPFNSPFWRALALPWAGLITTAAGALALVRACGGHPAGFLSPGTLAEMTANQAGDLGGGLAPPLLWPRCPWGLGPDLRGEKTPHWAPAEASPGSFGHSGASGCLAWADPAADLAWSIHGARTADSGWLLRSAPQLGAALLRAARG